MHNVYMIMYTVCNACTTANPYLYVICKLCVQLYLYIWVKYIQLKQAMVRITNKYTDFQNKQNYGDL